MVVILYNTFRYGKTLGFLCKQPYVTFSFLFFVLITRSMNLKQFMLASCLTFGAEDKFNN